MGAAKNARAIALHGKAPQRAAKQTNCASSPQRCSRKALSTNFTARGNLGQGRREKHTPNAAGASDEGNRRKPHRTANKSHIKRMPTKFKRIKKKSHIKRTRIKFKRLKKITHQANEDKIQTHTTHKQSKPAPGAVRPKSRLAFSLSINDMPLQFVCLKDILSCKQPIFRAAASLIYFFFARVLFYPTSFFCTFRRFCASFRGADELLLAREMRKSFGCCLRPRSAGRTNYLSRRPYFSIQAGAAAFLSSSQLRFSFRAAGSDAAVYLRRRNESGCGLRRPKGMMPSGLPASLARGRNGVRIL